MRLGVFDGPVQVAAAAGRWLADAARRADARRGRFVLGISGGSTPGPALRAFAAAGDVRWPRVTILQVDERIAPDGVDARNLVDQAVALAPALERGARMVALPAGGDRPDGERLVVARDQLHLAAGRPAIVDVVQLGLGADGHTASLVPEDAVLDEVRRDLAIAGPYRGHRRLTMTAPVLSRARHRLWIVTGAEKADTLGRLMSADQSVPAALINRRATTVMADRAAAGVS